MDHKDYWIEAVSSAIDEIGLTATKEQIEVMALNLMISAEQESMAFGPVPESPYKSELDALRIELKKEKAATWCGECNGKGWITIPGPYHSSTSKCFKCGGDGKIYPKVV